MQTLWQDLRYGARMLWKQPGFTLVVTLTLSLGIGANTAIYSALKAALFDALPYPDAAQLVVINDSNPAKGRPRFGASFQNFTDWKTQNSTLAGLAAYQITSGNLTGGGEPQRVRYAQTTADLFAVLNVPPLLGRVFAPGEEGPGKDQVAVLSHAFWQEQFGGERAIIGRSLTLSDKTVTVIGVMPPGFEFPDAGTQMWKPLGVTPDQSGSRGAHWLTTIARLKPGVTMAQAQTELSAIAARLAAQYPATNKGWGALVESCQGLLVSGARTQLLLLWGAVGLVLLIACANVANLLLARANERTRELTVRAALGASRVRLVRQLLTESVLLSLVGCLGGVLLAAAGLDALKQVIADLVTRAPQMALDWPVLGYALGLSLMAGIGFGLPPAFKVSQLSLMEALKDGNRTSTDAGGRRLRGLFVVAEIALAMVILIGAGLLLRSFVTLLNLSPGFDPAHVLTFRVAPPFQLTPAGKDPALLRQEYQAEKLRAATFYRDLNARLQALPGVVSAGAINRLPLTGNWWVESFVIEGREPDNPQDSPSANGRAVLPGYFQTMRVPLLQGRALMESDNETALPVVVINQAAARRYWGAANPVGQRLTFNVGRRGAPHWFTVVGVVGDERATQLELEPGPLLYYTMAQAQSGFGGDWGMDIVIKTQADPLALAGAVRKEVQALNPNLPIFNVNAMEQVVAANLRARRAVVLLLSVLAAVALLLAAVGIFGVVSYAVSRRTPEIGIRMALGAPSRAVLALMLTQGLKLALLGIGLGGGAAFALTRWLATLLYGVRPADPLTFGGVALLLLSVALLACWIPARRATKVDPMIALRCE
ncbi:MAG: ABC transporter permease [Blastocatellia bacterium]